MSAAATATTEEDLQPWSLESTGEPQIQRVRAHIGGLHCSLCTGTIERALVPITPYGLQLCSELFDD